MIRYIWNGSIVATDKASCVWCFYKWKWRINDKQICTCDGTIKFKALTSG